MGIVYVLTNKKNGKIYVGQTVQSFKRRFNSGHKKDKKSLIGRAIRKYGPENFSHFENEVPEQFMDNLERNLITLYGSLKPKGYNLESGGNKLKHVHEESKMKVSRANKGRYPSDATRRKLSEAHKGKSHTGEWRLQMSEAMMGRKNPNFGNGDAWKGRHHTEASRKKMSESRKGRFGKPSPFRGKHHSEATIKKMVEAHMGNIPWNKGKHLTKYPCPDTLRRWAKESYA